MKFAPWGPPDKKKWEILNSENLHEERDDIINCYLGSSPGGLTWGVERIYLSADRRG